MASLSKRPNSKLWWRSLSAQNGRTVKPSTGIPNRSDAPTKTSAWEKAAKAARKGRSFGGLKR
jgi:hypothetical protein